MASILRQEVEAAIGGDVAGEDVAGEGGNQQEGGGSDFGTNGVDEGCAGEVMLRCK